MSNPGIMSFKNDVARTVTCFHHAIPGMIPGSAPYATDAMIIECNWEAAMLMGYDTPEDLKGVCLSMVRDHEQVRNSQILLVAARTEKYSKVNDRSKQVIIRPNGERLWCEKSVVTLNLPERTVWVTELRVSSQPGTVPRYTPEEFGLHWPDIRRICGTHTVRSVQSILQNSLTTQEELTKILPENVQVVNMKKCNGLIIIGPRRKWKRFLYVCSKCGWPWYGNSSKPKQCPNRSGGCGTENWGE